MLGFTATRVLVLVVAQLAVSPAASKGSLAHHPVGLHHWDSGHYLAIMQHGYPPGPEIAGRPAFFPLYPLLCRPVALLVGPEIALLIVANACAILAAGVVYDLARRLFDPRAGVWCACLLGAYPPSMFLSAGYTEGLFLLTVSGTLWLLYRGRVLFAAAVCALATATRPNGLALAAVVVVSALVRQWPRRRSGRLAMAALVGLVAIGGFLAYMGYLWYWYGRPDAFFLAQRHWPVKPAPDALLRTLTFHELWNFAYRPVRYLGDGAFDKLLVPKAWNGLFVLLILLQTVVGLIRPRGIPRSWFLLPLLTFLLAYMRDPVTGQLLEPAARYQTAAVPCFLLAAGAIRGRCATGVALAGLVAMLLLQCFYAVAFAHGLWCG